MSTPPPPEEWADVNKGGSTALPPGHVDSESDRAGAVTAGGRDAPTSGDSFLAEFAERARHRGTGGGLAPGQVHPDLTAERQAASFDSRSLTYVLYGGARATQHKERIAAMIESDDVFDNADNVFLERTERYQRALAKSIRLQQLRREHNLSHSDFMAARDATKEVLPDDIHWAMFVPNVRSTCTEAQKRHWLPRVDSGEVVGCYAQTEMGHGSNVRGLQTTATYIADTDEFEIHTPSIAGAKWWPGGLGHTANHAMVFARLMSGGQDYGIQNFIVQIRDTVDHRPMAGVRLGDIGPKLGYNNMDNGFAMFDHVRIPRANMPSKYGGVERGSGVYKKPARGNSKMGYITMLGVRASLVENAGLKLAQAVAIAVRYSVVRRQGFSGDAKSMAENKVLDYSMQQYRLLPLLATTFAFQMTAAVMQQMMSSLKVAISSGDASALPEAHATSSGLKAVCTRIMADGIEEARKTCGGHGYLMNSGFPELLNTVRSFETLEGENFMIAQQTTRFLLKALAQGQKPGEKLPGNCSYLEAAKLNKRLTQKCAANKPADFLEAALHLEAFEHRAASVVTKCAGVMTAELAQGLTVSEARNAAMVEINRASRAHCMYTLVLNFYHPAIVARINGQSRGASEIMPVMYQLASLFALYHIEQDMGDFLETGYLSSAQADMVRSAIRALLKAIRPNAVALVDSFSFSDAELQTTLGRWDGRYEEALFESTERVPLNRDEPVGGYRKRVMRTYARSRRLAAHPRL